VPPPAGAHLTPEDIIMPRAKIYGYLAIIVSLAAAFAFLYFGFYDTIIGRPIPSSASYYAIAIPIGVVTLAVLVTGFWIGWTILTIQVVKPMPEIVEKKDYAKAKAFLLCLATLALAALFAYGLYLQSFWALAVPAAVITLVILGMVFWVGIAIITTRNTLPADKNS